MRTRRRRAGATREIRPIVFGEQLRRSRGNDEVSFGATGTDKTLGCVMKGGEAGVTDFRHAAMNFDMEKLRLDVSGVIALGGMKSFEGLQMTDCQITAHE